MSFPATRLRRLRRTAALRALTRETRLSPESLIYPLFVDAAAQQPTPIASMPGQYRHPVGTLPALARDIVDRGIGSVMLFGLPLEKDEVGTGAYDADGVVQRAVQEIKSAQPELIVITDTCLDEYTSHGHCGVIVNGDVDNDATLELLARTAVSQAAAGADMVAPSDMMDGRVGAIRCALDESGFAALPIMSYAAKYASAFYGPFRDAADCAPQFGDRRSYQMDPANRREALREVELDLAEGADIIMVKPALPYLDIIADVHRAFSVPVAAYNVSGEYAMIKAAAQQGWLDERATILEILTAIARAGAQMILTYHALEAAEWVEHSDARPS
ncbi:MAG TPA: porphobilinogen synthase [Chloroflexota bacterium]|nr:porphobilinogen synthase [Chloroflexota bacterium]